MARAMSSSTSSPRSTLPPELERMPALRDANGIEYPDDGKPMWVRPWSNPSAPPMQLRKSTKKKADVNTKLIAFLLLEWKKAAKEYGAKIVNLLCKHYHVSKNWYTKQQKKLLVTKTTEKKPRSGRPRKIKDGSRLARAIKRANDKDCGRGSYRDVAAATELPLTTVWRHMKAGDYVLETIKSIPRITHPEINVQWCKTDCTLGASEDKENDVDRYLRL